MNNYFGNAPVANEGSEHLRRAYLSHLYERVSRLEFSGVERQAEPGGRATFTLDQVYTALLTAEVAQRERDISAVAEKATRQISAVAQLNQQKRLVLLGAPGSGKSSFVNFVALCVAGELLGARDANLARLTAPLPPEEGQKSQEPAEAQPWAHGALIPVRVVLRNFAANGLPSHGQPATADHLWRYIERELQEASLGEFAEPLKLELRNVGGLILLDGLDEVPEAEARRSQIKEVVESFAAVFGRCRFVVTSRTYAYQNEAWHLKGFAPRVLAPFTSAQINAFVDRWYGRFAVVRDLRKEDAEGRALLLKQAIQHNERLQPLAEQPLLLTLMANLHAYRGGSLPERRQQLYAAAVDLLLDWWERQRVVYEGEQMRVVQPSLLEYLKIGKERMLAVLSELAFTVHQSNPDPKRPAVMRQADVLEALLSASADTTVRHGQLIEYLSQRAGLLSPEGNRIFQFPHRTFQEYLAALHLTGATYPDRVAELARSDANRWREVLLLAGAHAASGTESPIWDLVDALCFRQPGELGYGEVDDWGAHLAGQLLQENADLGQIRPRNQPKVEKVKAGLLHVMTKSKLPALERAHAGRTLAHLGDPRPEVMTVAGMQFCYIPAGPFLRQGKRKKETINYGYWMGRFPVTNAQYGEFMAAGGYNKEAYWAEAIKEGYWQKEGFKGPWDNKARVAPVDYGSPYQLANHPVVGVTWYEALAFCSWLTTVLQQNHRLPPDWQVNLPLELEWSKAACAGAAWPPLLVRADQIGAQAQSVTIETKPMPGRRYPWGDEFEADKTNAEESEINTTSAVGCFGGGASRYGVEELSGNVWEWLLQKLGDLAGGAYYNDASRVTTSARSDYRPYSGDLTLGFRCVVVPISH